LTAPRYFPFDPGAHRHRVGTRTLDPATWIEFGPDADAQLAQKRRLLKAHHDDIVVVLDGAPGPGRDAVTRACEELLDLVREHLAATAPERLTRPPPGAHPIGAHPIDLAARLVPEDLCLHLPGADGVLRLVAASVAFPSGWSLREKIGLPIGAIHDPVPGYAPQIGRATDRVIESLTTHRGLWRLNGSIFGDAELFRPAYPVRTAPPTVPDDVVLRVERQTLRRLPRTGAVVFTIRTYLDPLTSIEGDPAARARLASWLRGLDDEQRTYKRLETLAPAVLAWLET
jgi:hypothetical protein